MLLILLMTSSFCLPQACYQVFTRCNGFSSHTERERKRSPNDHHLDIKTFEPHHTDQLHMSSSEDFVSICDLLARTLTIPVRPSSLSLSVTDLVLKEIRFTVTALVRRPHPEQDTFNLTFTQLSN